MVFYFLNCWFDIVRTKIKKKNNQTNILQWKLYLSLKRKLCHCASIWRLEIWDMAFILKYACCAFFNCLFPENNNINNFTVLITYFNLTFLNIFQASFNIMFIFVENSTPLISNFEVTSLLKLMCAYSTVKSHLSFFLLLWRLIPSQCANGTKLLSMV